MNTAGFVILSTLGTLPFALLVWGAVALVVAVFGYLVAIYARETVTNR